MSQSQLRHYT